MPTEEQIQEKLQKHKESLDELGLNEEERRELVCWIFSSMQLIYDTRMAERERAAQEELEH